MITLRRGIKMKVEESMANIDSPRSRLHRERSIRQTQEMESRTKGQKQEATLQAAGEYSHLMGTDGFPSPGWPGTHDHSSLPLSAEMTSSHPTLGLSGFSFS